MRAARDAVGAYLHAAAPSNSPASIAHHLGLGAVGSLESKLRVHFRAAHALSFSSATSALFALGLALKISGKEFICPPLTWGGSISTWLFLGARPVFADTDANLTLRPDAVRRAITRDTAAILAVDFHGVPHNQDAIGKLAAEHGLFYVADSAAGLGAKRAGVPSGSLADAAVLSFGAGKTIPAGEGGAAVTNNTALYRTLLSLSQHPLRQRVELGLDDSTEFGWNARMAPLSAVWADAVFEHRLAALARRQRHALALLDAVNASGLTQPTHFSFDGILPTFSRVTAAWKGRPRPKLLLQHLRHHGFLVTLTTLNTRLLPDHHTFQTQFGSLARVHGVLKYARVQLSRRFMIHEQTLDLVGGSSK